MCAAPHLTTSAIETTTSARCVSMRAHWVLWWVWGCWPLCGRGPSPANRSHHLSGGDRRRANGSQVVLCRVVNTLRHCRVRLHHRGDTQAASTHYLCYRITIVGKWASVTRQQRLAREWDGV